MHKVHTVHTVHIVHKRQGTPYDSFDQIREYAADGASLMNATGLPAWLQ